MVGAAFGCAALASSRLSISFSSGESCAWRLCAGLTACILIWSLHTLGRKENVFLYDGSFSEWCVRFSVYSHLPLSFRLNLVWDFHTAANIIFYPTYDCYLSMKMIYAFQGSTQFGHAARAGINFCAIEATTLNIRVVSSGLPAASRPGPAWHGSTAVVRNVKPVTFNSN